MAFQQQVVAQRKAVIGALKVGKGRNRIHYEVRITTEPSTEPGVNLSEGSLPR